MENKESMAEVKEIRAEVTEQVSLAPGCWLLTVHAPGLAAGASPGQFALLGCGTGYDPFLRRPLSIHRVDRERGEVSFLYQVKGRGTAFLAARQKGERIPLLGPLGRGFRYTGKDKSALLVGAGLGAAPLLFLAEELARRAWRLEIWLGARSAGYLLQREAFRRCGTLQTITEDGSTSRQGTIVDLLRQDGGKGEWETIFACGPKPVLRAVQGFGRQQGVPAQLSVEERMACGLGACLGCVCRSRSGEYLRVCQEGPVFDSGEVLLDD